MSTALETRPTISIESAQRTSPWDALIVVVGLGFGLLGLRPLSDPDVWWHLRTGELIVHSGFTTSDPWSFASSKPWVLHEWGSEVLMYLSYALGGYRGLIVLHALGMLTLAVLLLRAIRREASAGIAAAVGLVAMIGLMPGSGERPQLISWCLLAAVLPKLRQFIDERRVPWWLVPLTWIWANLHGLWSAALVLYGFMVLGLLFDLGRSSWKIGRPFVAVGIASLLAAALTPNGPGLLLTPLHVRAYAPFVTEWQPPPLMSPFFGMAYLLVGILAVSFARRRDIVPATEICLAIGAVFMGLAYIRTIPILIIAIAPLAAAGFRHVWPGFSPEAFQFSRATRSISLAAVVLCITAGALWLQGMPTVVRHAPWAASARLDALPGHARVLNEYGVGGWLLWTARDVSPSIDGRTEIYSPTYVADAMGAPSMAKGWQDFVKRGNFDAALLSRDAPLVFGLKTQGWSVTYQDRRRVILLPPGPR